MLKDKRIQTTASVPLKLIEWSRTYYEEHKEDLTLLGVNSPNELIWRTVEFGKRPFDETLKDLKVRLNRPTLPQHET
ncbi:hypothetical protein [Candidatus Bathycorpusculum sp.]|uniref:hypothetical protein n=1 Tax=Candidatus Bathycorpusculum sp. TaxID=2994959 RepID=UPI00281E44B5|nr:hypothetical protein [Candidatus Termitimicrobium sp.]MCL2432065.1 hypothetical protein [Candidatus Termitimicrobium sp.]